MKINNHREILSNFSSDERTPIQGHRMKYDELKSEIQNISTICESIPEQYRMKCFDLLLNALLSDSPPAPKVPAARTAQVQSEAIEQRTEKKPDQNSRLAIPMTTGLRVLLQRTGITEDDLQKVLLVADGDVHFIKEPTNKKIIEGQISWALLIALKNCILGASAAVDPEHVRSICQDKGFYDKANFAANFKRPANTKLFKGSMVPQGEPQGLSTDGEKELAILIKELASQS